MPPESVEETLPRRRAGTFQKHPGSLSFLPREAAHTLHSQVAFRQSSSAMSETRRDSDGCRVRFVSGSRAFRGSAATIREIRRPVVKDHDAERRHSSIHRGHLPYWSEKARRLQTGAAQRAWIAYPQSEKRARLPCGCRNK